MISIPNFPLSPESRFFGSAETVRILKRKIYEELAVLSPPPQLGIECYLGIAVHASDFVPKNELWLYDHVTGEITIFTNIGHD